MSWSWSATALSLLLAMQPNVNILAFAPTTATDTPQFRTSIQFRYMDDDDAASNPIRSRKNKSNGSSTSSATSASTTTDAQTTMEGMSKDSSNISLESFYSMSIPQAHGTTSAGGFIHEDLMPSWLRPTGLMADGKLSALREIMVDSGSYLSRLEAEQVISAIREASKGNQDMIAGAADFCLVLVETMEMGVATLIAAAFHYCDAFVARQQSAQSPQDFSHLNYWTTQKKEDLPGDNARAIKIGQDAHQLIKDSARIKRAEMVASESMAARPRVSSAEAASIRKMILSETQDWRALAIRSAACLYRLRGIYEHFEDSNATAYSTCELRVAREALAIHAPLASRLGMHRLKNEIEGAAFRILYRRQYAKVTELTLLNNCCDHDECVVSSMKDGMRLVLNRVTEEVEQILQNDLCFSQYVESYKVTARVKEPYSLWRKMLKLKAKNILEVPDALALRIVLQGKKMEPDEDDAITSGWERALCYYAQQICMDKFKPLKDGRFKDYIANPKPNGYQSLHYTAVTEFENDAWPFEIQVRSNEMHQVAEFGLAAHWGYKAQETNDGSDTSTHYAFELDKSTDAYLRSVQEWHWERAQARGSWLTDSYTSPLFEKDAEKTARVRARDERLAPYLAALKKDHSNLTREHVLIFMSYNEDDSQQILELPAGACILDALRESERTYGFSSDGVAEIIHNGSLTSITQQLTNGDVVSIPKAP